MFKKMSWRGIEDAVVISKKNSFMEIAPHSSVARMYESAADVKDLKR
jgi:hypothetical protein